MGQVTAVVDFGTSHTVTVVSRPGAPAHLVSVDGQPWLSSAVFWGRDGRAVVGVDALRLARAEPARLERRPKARMGEDEVLLGDAVVPITHLVRAVLARVVAEAGAAAGAAVQHLVLTHPADWGSARLGVLLTAAQGLAPRLSTVPEPVAAAAAFAGGHELPVGSVLAVLDFGGGTCDAAVVRREVGGLSVVECAGLADLGGDDLDERVVEHLRDTQPGLAHLLDGVAGTPAPASRMSDVVGFREDVRAAKEVLSRHPQADIVLPGGLPDALVTRTELESRIRADLIRAVNLLADTVRRCGLSPADLAAVHLVGGSSRIPLLAQLLRAWTTAPIRLDEQPESVVALGAHALVAPPVPPGQQDPESTGQAPVPVARTAPIAPTAARIPPGPGAPRRWSLVIAAALVVAVVLTAATLVGFGGLDRSVAGQPVAAATAAERLTAPPPRPGGPVSVPGRPTAGLRVTKPGEFVDFTDVDRPTQWRLDSFEDSQAAHEQLVALGSPEVPGYRWILVRITQKAMAALPSDPRLDGATYLVDDRGLMIGIYNQPVAYPSPLPAGCPPNVRGAIAAGTEMLKCIAFPVPATTPIVEVAVAELANSTPSSRPGPEPLSNGARVPVDGRRVSGAAQPLPDTALPLGTPVRMSERNSLSADIAVVDVIENISAYFDREPINLPGSRGVIVRVAQRLTAPVKAEDLKSALVVVEDDRGAGLRAEPLSGKHECVNSSGDQPVSGTVTLCLLVAAPTGTPLRSVRVSLGGDTNVWRLP